MEAELTPEVKRCIDSIGGVTKYVSRADALFDRTARRRPKKLPIRRG